MIFAKCEIIYDKESKTNMINYNYQKNTPNYMYFGDKIAYLIYNSIEDMYVENGNIQEITKEEFVEATDHDPDNPKTPSYIDEPRETQLDRVEAKIDTLVDNDSVLDILLGEDTDGE